MGFWQGLRVLVNDSILGAGGGDLNVSDIRPSSSCDAVTSPSESSFTKWMLLAVSLFDKDSFKKARISKYLHFDIFDAAAPDRVCFSLLFKHRRLESRISFHCDFRKSTKNTEKWALSIYILDGNFTGRFVYCFQIIELLLINNWSTTTTW